MAMEEAQTRSRIHAVYAAREESTLSSELARVVEALERLTEKIEKKASTHNDEIQNSLALMKKHLAQPQVKISIPNHHYTHQPHAFVEDCVLNLDALYEHRFMIDGHERRVYRIRESH
jgi:hypothetical protein